MNKSLLIAASLAMMVTLAGCPGESNGPSTPATPSTEPSEQPTEPGEQPTEPGEQPSEPGGPATPGPTPTPAAPVVQPSALPALNPVGNVSVTLTSAQAVKQADFTYRFTITGSGFTGIEDLALLRFYSSDATLDLVTNGQARLNVEVREVNVSESQISFVWLPQLGAPTNNDAVWFLYRNQSGSAETRSSTLRLAVTN